MGPLTDQDDVQSLIPSASPLMTAAAVHGLDVAKILAGHPAEVAKAQALGIPVPGSATAGAAQTPPAVQSALATGAASQTPPAPSGTSANQPQPPAPETAPVQPNGKTPFFDNFGSNLAQAQVPATTAPNPAAEAGGAASVPASISPTGTQQKLTSGSNTVQEGVVTPTISGTSKPAASPQGSPLATGGGSPPVDVNAVESQLAAATSPRTAANPNGVPQLRDPNDPNSKAYTPTKWQRVGRGVLGGLEGLAEHGIAGALMGAVDPAAVGATAYGAPTRAFSDAAKRNAGMQTNLQQRLTQAGTNAKTAEEQAKAASEEPVPITADMGEQNPALKPFVGTSLPASAVKTVAAAGVAAQGRKDVAGLNADERAAALGLKSTTGPDGKITYSEDPNSPITKQKQALSDWRTSMQKVSEMRADIEKQKITPGSPAFNQRQQQISAEMKRADSYALRASGQMLGTDLQGNQLEGGATTATGKPIGTSLAAPYIKQEGKTAQFNDVLGATDRIESTAERLVNSGKRLNDPSVAAAIADPKTTSMQWAQGAFATSGLTPEQRDYVTNVKAYKENLQALRQASGGGFSDAQVNRLMEMAPGANTPDLDYLKRQIGQIRLTADRLAQGLPTMKGGHTVEGSGNKPVAKTAASAPPPGATHAYTDKNGAVVGYAVNGKYQAVK